MRSWITDLARAINRRTHRLDWLKDRLGITKIASSRLVSELTADDVAAIRNKLDTTSLLKDAGDGAHFVIVLVDKMGDVLSCTGIARYLKERYCHAKVTWFVKSAYRELLERNPNIDEVITVSCLSEAMDSAGNIVSGDPKAILVNLHFDGATCHKTSRCFRNGHNPLVNTSSYLAIGSLSESFSLAAGLPMVSVGPELYLPPKHTVDVALPQRYIVCHTMSDDPARNWRIEHWRSLFESLRAKGLSIVEIGGHGILGNADLDFSGMRRLVDIAYIIQHAACFVGVDSGFAHFANALHVPSVIIIGRFRNFPTYSPYSGSFSKSTAFILQRPQDKGPAANVTPASVLSDIDNILTQCENKN